jgi:DNA-binding NarL/FixJ family response regulator
LLVRTASGRRRVVVSTIAAPNAGERRLVHLLHEAPTVSSSSPAVREVAELTPREREVLELLGAGEGAKEIATRLGVSVATVRTHIRHILRKLGVHTQLAAVVRTCGSDG